MPGLEKHLSRRSRRAAVPIPWMIQCPAGGRGTRASLHGRPLDISLVKLDPEQGLKEQQLHEGWTKEAMRSGRKRWSGSANVSLDLLECRPNESGASGCRRLSGLAGAPQVGAAAERWAADWNPATPRSASHCRRQRPIHTQKTDFFFWFLFFFSMGWRPHGTPLFACSRPRFGVLEGSVFGLPCGGVVDSCGRA